MRRIGIDVGGTNTDAVLLEDGRVVHAVKTPTTADVTTGIVTALGELSAHPEVARGDDRRRRDRHDAFRQCGGAAAGAGARRRDPDRAAGRRLAAAVLRLAARISPSWSAARCSCWKAGTITTAARSCRSTRPACASAARSIKAKRDRLGRDRRDLLAARPVLRGARARRSWPRNAPRPPLPCRVTSAASACSNARTRRC